MIQALALLVALAILVPLTLWFLLWIDSRRACYQPETTLQHQMWLLEMAWLSLCGEVDASLAPALEQMVKAVEPLARELARSNDRKREHFERLLGVVGRPRLR